MARKKRRRRRKALRLLFRIAPFPVAIALGLVVGGGIASSLGYRAPARESPAPLAQPASLASRYVVGTLAGGQYGTFGFLDGPWLAARFNRPTALAFDAAGDLYVADWLNFAVRIVSARGLVVTLAGGEPGYTDGPLASARFALPEGLAIDPWGNLFVADRSVHCIRWVSPDGSVATVAGALEPDDGGVPAGLFADGAGPEARFSQPRGLAVDVAGRVIVADWGNNRIRLVDRDGTVSTLAGSGPDQEGSLYEPHRDGPGHAATFNGPVGVAAGPGGDVYVADAGSNCIRRIRPDGTTSTLAGSAPEAEDEPGLGDGPGHLARFHHPAGVAVGPFGRIYVADTGNHGIRLVSADGTVETIAGNGQPGFADGSGDAARFHSPQALVLGPDGTLYVADTGNNRIRTVRPATPSL